MGLTKEEILGTPPPIEAVAWTDGDEVWVSAMDTHDRDAFEIEQARLNDDDDDLAHMSDFRSRLLVRCFVDGPEQRRRLFEDSDAAALSAVWCAPMDRAFETAKKLNGFRKRDIEDLEKNSAGAPSDSSGTT